MMTIDYRFGDLDAHGVMIGAQALALEAEQQAIIGDVPPPGTFGRGPGSGVLPTVHRRPGPQFPGRLPAGQRSWRQGADRRRVTFHPFERPNRYVVDTGQTITIADGVMFDTSTNCYA